MGYVEPDILAFDVRSARRSDRDGHLHVEATPISKAAVNGYLGVEIPRFREKNLDPTKTYQMLRDPDELARAAETFAGKPLLSSHKNLTAKNHDRNVVIGAIGNDAAFDGEYIRASISVWDGAYIGKIESGSRKELSSSYYYEPDMTPGVFNGVPYDGRMTNIVANHVALVDRGRAGPDVAVADSINGDIMNRLSERALLVRGVLAAYGVAADADINAILLEEDKPERDASGFVTAVAEKVKGALASDSNMVEAAGRLASITPVMERMGSLTTKKDEEKPRPGKEPRGALSDDLCGNDAAPTQNASLNPVAAEDAEKIRNEARLAGIEEGQKLAMDEFRRHQREYNEAVRATRDIIGDAALSYDSADQVYRHAIKLAGYEVGEGASDALPVMARMAGEIVNLKKGSWKRDAGMPSKEVFDRLGVARIKGGI